MNLILVFVLFYFLNSIVLCFDDPPSFGPRINKGEINNDEIDEASGLAASYKNQGILWTHNDSGGENRVFAIDTNGVNRGTFYLNGVENRDWEDITIGPGPDDGLSYIYVGDIGDNNAEYSKKYIYRVQEPNVSANQNDTIETIQNVSVITFIYPDGERDAETLMIDPISKDLYIIGKRDSRVRLYKLPYPQSTSNVFEAELVANLSFPNDPESEIPNNYITSGDISLDGTQIIVKSYSNIYYWEKVSNSTIEQTMLLSPSILPYEIEPQGEAVCWSNSGTNGYYTLSEEKININNNVRNFPAQLYYYSRSTPVSINEENINNKFELNQNFPNPFNPTTTIKYSAPTVETKHALSLQHITLKIYDILGKEMVALVNEKKQPGNYEVKFDGSNLTSGVYYYSLRYGNFIKTKKMVLIK